MKKFLFIAVLALFMAQFSAPALAQRQEIREKLLNNEKLTKKEKAEIVHQLVIERIDAKLFDIDINRITSFNQQFHGLDSGYGLGVKEDVLTVHLPAAAGIVSGAYGNGEQLKFEAKIENYQVSQNKKATIKTIEIEATNEAGKYWVTITAFKTARCEVKIKAQGMTTTTYEGVMRLL